MLSICFVLLFGCTKLNTIYASNKFITDNVTVSTNMFYGCNKLKELDLSSFDTSNVVEMSYMFNRASSLEKIYASEKFVTDNVINSDYMFWVTPNLVGGNGTLYNGSYRDKTYARIVITVDDIRKFNKKSNQLKKVFQKEPIIVDIFI